MSHSTQNVPMVELGHHSRHEKSENQRLRNRIIENPIRTIRPLPTMTTVTTSSSKSMAQQMTIAGSFLDLALFVADVEHLKYLLDAGKENIAYYNMLMFLIGSSLVLQIIVMVLMIISGFRQTESTTVRHHRESDEDDYVDGNKNQGMNNGIRDQITLNDSGYLNKVIIVLVAFIAIINVFATVFGNRSSADLIMKYRAGRNISLGC